MSEDLRGNDSASILVSLRPAEHAWILQGPLTDAFIGTAKRVVLRDGDLSAECTISTMSVKYEQCRRSSLFGERLVDRIVDLRIQMLVADQRSGRILYSGLYANSSRDTIQVSAITRLEDSSIPVTKGELPQDDFLSTFAEPIILIGAVAVSVFLLFHVRS